MTIDYLEGETIISRKASGWSSKLHCPCSGLFDRASHGLAEEVLLFQTDRESPVSLSSAPRAYVHWFIGIGRNLLILCFGWMIF